MDLSTYLRSLTWTCHICGAERPDEKISVHHRPLPGKLGEWGGRENIRYCNDDYRCYLGALDFTHLPSLREREVSTEDGAS